MAWAPDYCTSAELKTWLRKTNTDGDTQLGQCIGAASRAIDAYCGRQFGSVSPAVTRYYTWDGGTYDCRSLLLTDDIHTTTSLVVAVDTDGDGDTDQTLTSGTDFDLWPANAAAESQPWRGILLRNASATPFNRYGRGLVVTAQFGWAAVPDEVVFATLTQASRFFGRRVAWYGVAGSPELGSEIRLLEKLDVDVANSVHHLRRVWAGV